jgi:hypothetical protein
VLTGTPKYSAIAGNLMNSPDMTSPTVANGTLARKADKSAA